MAMLKNLAMPAAVGGGTVGMIAMQAVSNKQQLEAQERALYEQDQQSKRNLTAINANAALAAENRKWLIVGGVVAVVIVVGGVVAYKYATRDISEEIIELNRKIDKLTKDGDAEVLLDQLRKRRAYLFTKIH